ncbi:hypothetical protein B0A69_03995 [Chryseobacterium shigense]|uniref:Uncharacterized protein n=1 Tax=Chryseobacterium shigense TaxID=297244 RepID=A0A1N7IRU1_9FLAO|nr:hypothetical protein [Chryseobacterium shigense]PQA95553.1 hypothetical protein B0A69_03995 [Chryseobacterium shigense]SIS39802.1 hypothetical protein SAMN05421639_104472 [Chryseobacterium shigense]
MSTIDKKNIKINPSSGESNEKMRVYTYNLTQDSSKNIILYTYPANSRFPLSFGNRKNQSRTVSKKRKGKYMFQFRHRYPRYYNRNIIIEQTDSNKLISSLKITKKYLAILGIQNIEPKETTESYLLEFIYNDKYYLIEFFHDNDIVLLIRENDKRKAWDLTTDHLPQLLNILKQDIYGSESL